MTLGRSYCCQACQNNRVLALGQSRKVEPPTGPSSGSLLCLTRAYSRCHLNLAALPTPVKGRYGDKHGRVGASSQAQTAAISHYSAHGHDLACSACLLSPAHRHGLNNVRLFLLFLLFSSSFLPHRRHHRYLSQRRLHCLVQTFVCVLSLTISLHHTLYRPRHPTIIFT